VNGVHNTNVNDILDFSKNRQNPNANPMDMSQNEFGSSFQHNGIPSRMNSIGSFLGANLSNNQTAAPNYSQMMQNMAQQYQPGDLNQSLPGQFPPNQTSSMPVQNPMPTNLPQDNDAIMRYLAASGQMPQQSQQLDPNMMAMLAQQNQQMNQPNQQNQQMSPQQMAQQQLLQQQMMQQQMMQQQNNLGSMSQMGGAKRNPFFFQ